MDNAHRPLDNKEYLVHLGTSKYYKSNTLEFQEISPFLGPAPVDSFRVTHERSPSNLFLSTKYKGKLPTRSPFAVSMAISGS
jgi:hypothetical protein